MAEEKAPTDAEAMEGYNPQSGAGAAFDATSTDFSHDFPERPKGIEHVLEHKPFDPERVGLAANFNLLAYSKLRGSGAKVPQSELRNLLQGIGSEEHIGGDVAIVESNLYSPYLLVSTVDYFYSPVEDPWMTGWIAATNMMSDIYAAGLQYVDNVLMSLAASSEMPEKERFIVTKLMMLGFDACVKSAGSVVTGGQSVMNPWPILGGIAKTICEEKDIVPNNNAAPGDVIVLTKPLGTTQCTDALAWSKDEDDADKLSGVLTAAEIDRGYRVAEASMARSSRPAAILMHKHGSHGATDITGFGLLGESSKIADVQKNAVDFLIHTLPCIKEAIKVDAAHPSGLTTGTSPETSGPLFVILPAANSQAYRDEIKAVDGWEAYEIGTVVAGTRQSRLADNVTIIEV